MDDQSPVLGANEVFFAKNIVINTGARLPAYDNGKALAYDAYDITNKKRKFIALVSGIDCLPRWPSVSTYDALSDTSFIRMVGNGIIMWPLDGKQKYVFMYSGGIGGCLVKEGEFTTLTWRHPEVVEFFIQPMARLLKEMSDKNFHHGSIRPSNIFHSSADKRGQVILGDCLSVQSCSTQPEIFMPIEKACMEPMARGNGSIQDDIYALGVSLALILRKNDELQGLSSEEILKRKIEMGTYATIIGKERFQAVFLEFLRGTLHDDADHRWGIDEIMQWLDGTRLNPPQMSRRRKANRPLHFDGHKYLYADLLAVDIHKNPTELAQIVEDGSLFNWIEKSLGDPFVLDRYQKVTERIEASGGSAVNRDFVVSEVRMALYPRLPIRYKSKVFNYDGLGNIMALACYNDSDLSQYKEIIMTNILDHALSYKGSSNDSIMWFKLFDNCRVAIRQQHKIGYGIEKCIYLLSKNAPCLSPVFKGYFVNGHNVALVAYEKICARGGQVALLLDQHAVAFFSVLNPNAMDKAIYDIDSDSKIRKIIGNLKLLASMQEKSSGLLVPALGKLFLDSLDGAYMQFKNKLLREKIKEAVVAAGKSGDLVTMVKILEDETALVKDAKAFQIARAEYKALQIEYENYDRKLANKKTYGVVNGRDSAVVVAWVISTIINMLVVFAFISGYRIF